MNRVVVSIVIVALSSGASAQPAGSRAPDESPAPAGPAPAGPAPAGPAPAGPAPVEPAPVEPAPVEPAPAPAPVPAPTAAELAELERALAADQTARDDAAPAPAPTSPVSSVLSAMNPDLSFILDVAAAWFSEDDNLQTGAHDPTKTGFNLQQLELSIGKAVDPYFRFDSNIVFSQFGVEIEEAYATTLALPHNLQIRAGQFLTRFGRLNPTHPHSWDFVDQPFAIGRVFGAEGNRGLGAEVSYLTPAPFFLELVASATEAGGEATARSFFGPVDLPVESPLDVVTTLATKAFFDLSANWSLFAGASLAAGPNGTGHDNRTDVWGVDLYLKYRPITRASNTIVAIQSEWLYRRRQVPDRLVSDVNGYAYVFWKFAQRWGTAARYELGTGDGDELDPAWLGSRHRVTWNATFWPTEFSRLRAQASVDLPTWRDAPIWATFLAAEFVVGAHGAHKF